MATVPELMDALERAYDEFASARLAHANAKADYERVRLGAKAHSKEKSQAAKEGEAEIIGAEEKQRLIIAEGLWDITKTHVQVLLGELVAAQSQQKYAGKLDGGEYDPHHYTTPASIVGTPSTRRRSSGIDDW